jgi:hypothetical protein
VSRCVVEDRRQTQSGGRREYSAKANDNYIGSLINTNSDVKSYNFLKNIIVKVSSVICTSRYNEDGF